MLRVRVCRDGPWPLKKVAEVRSHEHGFEKQEKQSLGFISSVSRIRMWSMCAFVFLCMQMCMDVCVHTPVEARGQSWLSFLRY